MARLDWDRETRLARWRAWLSSLPIGSIVNDIQTGANDGDLDCERHAVVVRVSGKFAR